MKRFLLTVAVLALTVCTAQAGPLGLFGGCGCKSGTSAQRTGPVRKIVQHLRDKRPAATAVANTFHAAVTLVESRPVATAVRSAFGSSCPGGVCPK